MPSISPRIDALLLTTVVGLALLPGVGADHIRVMTVYQSSSLGDQVTMRVDYQPSGNCCGGNFRWIAGVPGFPGFSVDNRLGGPIPDGVVSGCYVGDVPDWTPGMFNDGFTGYEWRRVTVADFPQYVPPVCVPSLVRIEIKYSYPTATPPEQFMVQWWDCCPQSGLYAPVEVTGAAIEASSPARILALDTGDSVETSLILAGFESCDNVLLAPVCYQLEDPLTFSDPLAFPKATLDTYNVIYAGSNAPAAQLALNNRAAVVGDLDDWIYAGGGIVSFGQSSANWAWVPHKPLEGGVVAAATTPATQDTVWLTVEGLGHASHLNQLAGVPPAVPSSLSNWGPSAVNVFTEYPSFFNDHLVEDDMASGPLSRLGDPLNPQDPLSGPVVSLAGPWNEGCVFISGQPADERATAGNKFYAAALVRSSLHYALTCDPENLILPF